MSSQSSETTNSVGRNSLIMAAGTAASRVTGQIRSILLAAAIGTTGIAANAYQTGSMIPQVIFTLISGGIFNAVLVPQIVRTLKHEDANERLNKLITVSITLLIAVTAVMMLGTPLVTRLYVNPNWAPDQRALVNAFTLWCMPQIFFYGLYLVLGQILAAKGRFGMYAWSSVGANVISCAGFTAFIMLFGKADRMPMDFWTEDKILLTAGTWTLGVAFQAVILFLPLMRLGLHYRPKWGLHGIGLRSMGKVAAWSLAMTMLNLVVGMVTSQINTGAPHAGHDLYNIAGNGSYQYAYSLYILPYSLIAVSITTAVFPKLSRAISDHDVATAREDLSSSLRTVGLSMVFFSAALIAMPVPITRALLPSVNVHDALLIAGPLVTLSIGLVPISAFLLIQRTFYAYEDGKSPFLFALLENAVQMALLLPAIMIAPPQQWATLVGLALSLAYILTIPFIFLRLRKRMGGNLDGRRIIVMHAKAIVAGVAAGVACWLACKPVMRLLHVDVGPFDGHMGWIDSLIICIVGTIVTAVVYALLLMALRVDEFTSLVNAVKARFLHRGGANGASDAANTAAESDSATEDASFVASSPDNQPASGDANDDNADHGIADRDKTTKLATAPVTPPVAPPSAPSTSSKPSPQTAADRIPSGSPTYRMTKAHQQLDLFAGKSNTTMKPGLGDTLIDRYTLVQILREEPGISVWRANDSVMAKDCQLFLITDSTFAGMANDVASALTLSHNKHFTPIQQIRSDEGACIIVTDLDHGISLERYLAHNADDSTHALSAEAIRTIVGETVEAAKSLRQSGLNHRAISAATIRMTSQSVTLADAPISAALVPPLLRHAGENPDSESVVIRQIAAVLYQALTGHVFDPADANALDELPAGTPDEYTILCARGLGIHDRDHDAPIPISTLDEFEALLGTWKPMTELTRDDIVIPSHPSSPSVKLAEFRPANETSIVPIPQSFLAVSEPQIAQQPSELTWRPNQLFSKSEVDNVDPSDFEDDGVPLGVMPQGGKDFSGRPTMGLDVASIRAARGAHDFGDEDTWEGDPENVPLPGGVTGQVAPPSFTPAESAAQRSENGAAAGAEEDPETTMVIEPLPASFEPQVPVNPPSYMETPEPAETNATPETKRKLGRKRIAIVVGTVVALLAIFLGSAAALGLFSPKSEGQKSSAWPSFNSSDVAFPGATQSASPSASGSASASPSESASSSAASSTPSEKKSAEATPTVITADKNAKKVPDPKQTEAPQNTTEYATSSQTFVNRTSQYNGRGWHIRLTQPQDVSRLVVSIRQSGGKAQVYAGATSSDPTGGELVGEFSFDASGTTEVKLNKTVNTQDIVIWVPVDTTPEGGLYFNGVKVY
ncbi:murein biosynthesis integral membrane protein MurJ [Bifidobacterium callimiconis]|uniref:MviN-like protein n=1 Tax=Bifidobacterium callimiconis TaxID=2306973 RepID=A0A430FBB6_9BIFI|nr:murein biosynthesis integral membrane protein MurJ [Bifidobacterium callimiconis]RSX50126.1 MviN-like protein [Bifidobacterium callimiconis]